VIALGLLGSLATVALGAGQGPWTPRRCIAAGVGPAVAARSTDPLGVAELRLTAWYRLDPRLDRAGALQGQRLALGMNGDHASRYLDLPSESFAAGPFGQLVLVGRDDGVTSQLAAIDVVAGCSFDLAQESSVIRRATVDPEGTTVYETRVDRATRVDLGIWSRPIDGTRPAVQVLGPIDPDERFGPTFSTEFAWDATGDRLAVQSCGMAACRVRVIDPAGGAPQLIAEPDLGTLVALAGSQLIAYQACPGLPCPILGVDLGTGGRRVLADAGAASVVVSTPDGPRLVHEVLDASGVSLRSVGLDGSAAADLGRLPDGLRLQPNPPMAEAATRLPAGWVLVTPDGRLSSTGPSALTQLRHVPDGASVQLQEAAR
jgi:hypothetical protein